MGDHAAEVPVREESVLIDDVLIDNRSPETHPNRLVEWRRQQVGGSGRLVDDDRMILKTIASSTELPEHAFVLSFVEGGSTGSTVPAML